MKHLFNGIRISGILFCITAFCSCGLSKKTTLPFEGYIDGVTVKKPISSFVGPCAMEDDLPAKTKDLSEKNKEKGGKASFVPPSYMMAKPEKGIEVYAEVELLQQANVLKKFAVENNYDTEYAFLVNMSIKSGKKRFYVVNLQTMAIENSSLVAHGRGDERFTFDKEYSNAAGSNCSSLGRYKVGKSYTGQFGLAYKLCGLDNTNSNAYNRFVVLHAMGCISYEETDSPICQSEGCPAIAPQFLEEIKPIIDSREKPMLLWVFDSVKQSKGKK